MVCSVTLNVMQRHETDNRNYGLTIKIVTEIDIKNTLFDGTVIVQKKF